MVTPRITFVIPYYHNVWEPLGIGYVASYLFFKMTHHIEMYFVHENFDNEATFTDYIQRSDYVALTCTTPTFARCLELVKRIKVINPFCKTIVGGWHVTALPEVYPNIDYLVVGEGEDALFRIISNKVSPGIVQGKRMNFEELHWPIRPFQKQTLALCESHGSGRIGSFQSRRGCMNNCSICAESCMTGKYNKDTNPVRVRNPEDLLAEIEAIHSMHNLTKFKFVDPTHCFPKQAEYDFCEAKIRSNLDLPWEAMVHAAYLDKDLLKLMKASGCEQINVGCESGSQKILNDMRKGVTTEQIKKVFKIGKSLGLNMRAFFILGMPNETRKTIEETKQLVREIDPDVFGITILCPYPGSDYYDARYENEDWSKADEYLNSFWSTQYFTNKELQGIQAEFETEFKDKLTWHQKVIKNNERNRPD